MNQTGFFGPLDAESLSALAYLLKLVFFMGGVFMVGHGIWKLTEASQAGKQEGLLGFRSIMIGGALMSMGPLIGYVSTSFSNTMSSDTFNRIVDFSMIEPGVSPGTNEAMAKYQAIINSFVNMLILFGYWSVGKGLLMFKKTSDGAAPHLDEGALSAITHIGFGSLLVNSRVVMPSVLVNVMGFDPQIIRSILG